ncbi:MAG: hypothetical protein V3T18_04215 [Pseudomonadales bacterium]
MTPNPVSPAFDSESLQADVMRFMAIIAFCLIAILALVRNVEAPQVPQPQTTKPIPAPVALPRWQEPIEKPEPKILHREVQRVTPAPLPEPATVITQSLQIPATEPVAVPEPVVVSAPVESVPEEQPEAPAVPPLNSQNVEDEGLTLRFASDGDFLRLIAKGAILVYAYNESGVFALQPDYQFLPSAAPGQVYQLMEQTVPTLILDALERTQSDAAPFTWAIAIPPAIRNQIENHMASARSGQLVINRYGEVHHVARHRS